MIKKDYHSFTERGTKAKLNFHDLLDKNQEQSICEESCHKQKTGLLLSED